MLHTYVRMYVRDVTPCHMVRTYVIEVSVERTDAIRQRVTMIRTPAIGRI